jgi:hypothetical protein
MLKASARSGPSLLLRIAAELFMRSVARIGGKRSESAASFIVVRKSLRHAVKALRLLEPLRCRPAVEP